MKCKFFIMGSTLSKV